MREELTLEEVGRRMAYLKAEEMRAAAAYDWAKRQGHKTAEVGAGQELARIADAKAQLLQTVEEAFTPTTPPQTPQTDSQSG